MLAEFLAEQRRRLSAETFSRYRDVVELLQHSLNDYAYTTLNEADAQFFDRLRKVPGDADREFCDIFGPEHILPNVGEFLGYFMVRKVFAGSGLRRAAGTVTKVLARWLEERGYTNPEQARMAVERGTAAARDLPKAGVLASRLSAFAATQAANGSAVQVEDHFRIARVEPGRIWLEALGGRECVPIQLPEALCLLCPVGWTVSGVIGRAGQHWKLLGQHAGESSVTLAVAACFPWGRLRSMLQQSGTSVESAVILAADSRFMYGPNNSRDGMRQVRATPYLGRNDQPGGISFGRPL